MTEASVPSWKKEKKTPQCFTLDGHTKGKQCETFNSTT